MGLAGMIQDLQKTWAVLDCQSEAMPTKDLNWPQTSIFSHLSPYAFKSIFLEHNLWEKEMQRKSFQLTEKYMLPFGKTPPITISDPGSSP